MTSGPRVVFVLIDGLCAASTTCMGYMSAHTEQGAVHGTMPCELPPMSRPIYTTFFTGLSPLHSGITHNDMWQLPPQVQQSTLFARLQGKGRSSAAAAYYWMRELYNAEPYDPLHHRFTLDASRPIQNGVFYSNDAYPDDHVFQDALVLQQRCKPDFLLVHTMGVDYAGHIHGLESCAYRHAVRQVDMLLAQHVPLWLQQNYMVVITSDHGMHADAAHNDTTSDVRSVPFWILGANSTTTTPPKHQTEWYELLCKLFGL